MAQTPSQSDALALEAAEQGNWSLAYAYYQDAFSKDSLSFERKYQLAFSAMKVYEDALAMRLFQEVNRADQGKIHPEALYYLGKLHQRQGNYPMAEQVWKKLKKKIAKVNPDIVTKAQLDKDLEELAWSMLQAKDPAIELEWYPWNSSKSEAHAQWKGDTIVFQQWNGSGWEKYHKVPAVDSVQRIKEMWKEREVMQITSHNQWTIGVVWNDEQQPILLEKNLQQWTEIAPLNLSTSRSSMPALAIIDGIPILFFASDRPGGHGGWDIWASRWKDAWQAPFPLGNEVNTEQDEVSPMYDESTLYFASKGHKGFGEMDIFQCKGKPGQWQMAKNLGQPINSSKNDMGLAVRRSAQSEEWLLASARNNDGCCLDIGHWTLWRQRDSIERRDSTSLVLQTIQQWLPLSLYFHNDEPNPRSSSSKTDWNYTQCWQSYLAHATEYENNGVEFNEWEQFESEQLQIPYEKFQRIMQMMLIALQKGDTLRIQVRGLASPLAAQEYNEKLTSRRVQSIKNELFQYQNGAFTPFWEKQLWIDELPLGEMQSDPQLSDDSKNKRESIYSAKARAARRIEILDIR